MTTSLQAVVEDALLALLQADPTLGTIEGPPRLGLPASPARRAVWIMENADTTQVASLTANTPQRRETHEINVAAFATQLGDDWQGCRDRGVELVAAIEQVVRTQWSVSGTAFFAQIARIERSSFAWDKTRGVLFVVHVAVENYISGA